MRIDLLLVEWGMAPTRTKAQELIKHGQVERRHHGRWETVLTSSFRAEKEKREEFRILNADILQFVSRGGLKLASALDHVEYQVDGLVALDIGLSTGGFTDCLLQRGAKKVIGIDVGRNQLAERLRCDARLLSFEQVNARDLCHAPEAVMNEIREVSLCVVDVSFISVRLILPQLMQVLPKHKLLALIKPQFELDENALNKSGIVTDPKDLELAKERVVTTAMILGYKVKEIFPCRWKGGDGNQEFFLWAEK